MLNNEKLYQIAEAIMSPKKGILAADQSPNTINKQLGSLNIPTTAEVRRKYRQLLFTAQGIEKYVTGIIVHDGTIRNHDDDGTLFPDIFIAKGIIPIIKVDTGTVPHHGFDGEVVTQGVDGLQNRLQEYYDMGARAAKFRVVFNISDTTPSEQNISFNCTTLSRYAQLCHEVGIVPIVEPEVIYNGSHSLQRAKSVTITVLKKLFETLEWNKVDLRAVILKSSMVLAGSEFEEQTSPQEVAKATIQTFRNSVPDSVPGIVFLSGGQSPQRATENLDAISKLELQEDNLPWKFSFSFSRAIEQPVQSAWLGHDDNIKLAQEVLLKRLNLNSIADQGKYAANME